MESIQMTTLKSHLNLHQRSMDYLSEDKNVVFTFGRFNPPTKGHQRVIDLVQEIAEQQHGDHMILVSQSVDKPPKRTGRLNPLTSKNPLPYDVKLAFLKQMFPTVNIVENAPSNPWDVPEWLANAGYVNVTMVVGSDQMEDFSRLVESSAGIFNNFQLVSSGIRNPDASGVSGMSATKAREAARLNDIGKFRVATGWSGEFAERLMEATRISMGSDV